MQKLISEDYVKQIKQMHEEKVNFGAIGCRHVDKIIKLAQVEKTQDILDYGCGKSTLARNLPFTIQQYDPGIEKYSDMPRPADIVVCTDVLEHIEPDCLESVLVHMASLTKVAGYFTACTMEAKKHLPDGRNAHLIIKPAKWWVNKLYEYFEVMSFQKQPEELVVVVEPLNFKGIKHA